MRRRRMVDLLSGPRPAGVVLVALVALTAAACGGREAGVETTPAAGDPPPAAEAPAAGEARGEGAGEAAGRPVPATDPGAGTPARRAAERLVDEGVGLLRAGRVVEAARTLERAIRLDPSHGEAYHQLARVRARQGREQEALGLLERAVELLRPYPERLAEAETLRRRLSGG